MNPDTVFFSFYAYNEEGEDRDTLDVPVDIPPSPPYFYQIYLTDTLDEDGDGYFEEWTFEVDIDAYSASATVESVYIQITDDLGNSYGPFGPFDFYGWGTSDNVFIGPFSMDSLNLMNPDTVFFSFYAYNEEGEDWDTAAVPVDTPAVAVEEPDSPVSPPAFSFDNLTPNPARGSVLIEFTLPRSDRVRISLYDVVGTLVEVITDRVYGAGKQRVLWKARGDLARGIYFVRLEYRQRVFSRKLVIIK